MRLQSIQKIYLIFVLFILLIGCNPQALETNYEMNFNGRSINATTGNAQKVYELEDNYSKKYEVCIDFKSVEDDKKGMEYLSLILTDADTKKVYLFEDLLYGQYLSYRVILPRAEFTDDNLLRVYFENWRASLVAGYVNGTLAQTDVVEIDIEKGEVINSWKAGKNEFIVTSDNRKIYIYNMGKLYTRNFDNWETITEIVDLELADIKAEDVQTLFFDVNADSFSIYKSMDWGLDDPTKSKEWIITVQTNE